MNIYKKLNQLIDYVENHLEEKIEYNELAQILCVNEYTMQRLFSILCDCTISEYIRKRRLSNAGFDVYKNEEKIMDIAVKYQYDSATSFSRAFEKFHGIKPSQVKNNPEGLKIFTKLTFDENISENKKIEYSIIEMPELVLYGIDKKTDTCAIKKDAPEHYKKIRKMYGEPPYGMIAYTDRFNSYFLEYWILYKTPQKGLKKYIIPAGKWLQFRIQSQEAKEIQRVSEEFYTNIIPSSKYNLKPIPELEYYHDDITDFLVPIED